MLNWKVNNLERTLPSGVVFTIHYSVDLVDGEFTAGAYGSLAVAGDPEREDFVPFEELTEAKVIEWVQEALGAEKIAEIEAALAGQIEKQKNPTSAAGLPWVNVEATQE